MKLALVTIGLFFLTQPAFALKRYKRQSLPEPDGRGLPRATRNVHEGGHHVWGRGNCREGLRPKVRVDGGTERGRFSRFRRARRVVLQGSGRAQHSENFRSETSETQ